MENGRRNYVWCLGKTRQSGGLLTRGELNIKFNAVVYIHMYLYNMFWFRSITNPT